jgi:hypothetical protein
VAQKQAPLTFGVAGCGTRLDKSGVADNHIIFSDFQEDFPDVNFGPAGVFITARSKLPPNPERAP